MIYCAICEGTGKVPECFCSISRYSEEVIWTGKDIVCPGCDGTGVSERAKKEREKISDVNSDVGSVSEA